MAVEVKFHDGKMYVSADVAAVLCNSAKATLNNWRKQENPPPYNEEIGMYPAAEFGLWIRTEMIFKKGKGGGYPHLPDMTRLPGIAPMPAMPFPSAPTVKPITVAIGKHDAEIRLKTLQADKVEMELKQAAGELIPIEDVTHALTNMVMRVKTRLLRLPAALAPLVSGVTDVYGVQKRIEDGVREALDELSDDWRDGQDNEGVEDGE